jgi:hypothetical protein
MHKIQQCEMRSPSKKRENLLKMPPTPSPPPSPWRPHNYFKENHRSWSKTNTSTTPPTTTKPIPTDSKLSQSLSLKNTLPKPTQTTTSHPTPPNPPNSDNNSTKRRKRRSRKRRSRKNLNMEKKWMAPPNILETSGKLIVETH